MTVNLQRGINPALCEIPERRARWAHLLNEDKLRAAMKGLARSDDRAIEQKRWIMEAMMDNQVRSLDYGNGEPMVYPESMIDALNESTRNLNEDATLTSIGWTTPGTIPVTAKVFTTQSLGMIRRVFPRLIMPDLVSVQPLSQPTGKIFFLDFKFSHPATTGGADAIAAGDNVYDNTQWSVGVMAEYSGTLSDGTTSATTEAGGAGDVDAREMHMDISSVDVVAESKKLAADWSVEVEQDLRVYHGLSADEELMNATAAEITREIDRKGILVLDAAASGQTVSWNKNGAGTTLPTEVRAYNETIYDAIEDAAGLIEKKRYKRPTWILTNVAGATRLRKLNGFHASATLDPHQLTIGMGARRIFGTIQEQFVVYIDPWYRVEDANPSYIVGYKGDSFFETGVIYAPYVPFYRSPPFTHPKTFKTSRGIMSRFAFKRVIDDVYSKVVVSSS